jgi:hypothetical protein
MPTYLNSREFMIPRDSTFYGANFSNTNTPSSQIACPLIYDHIKTCNVCQQAVKNTCSAITDVSQVIRIDKHTLVLYGMFLLFLIILITVIFKR